MEVIYRKKRLQIIDFFGNIFICKIYIKKAKYLTRLKLIVENEKQRNSRSWNVW